MLDAAPHSRVRQRREAAGLSQGALAALVGLSRQSVQAIEAGRAVPGVDVALRLARALGVSVEALFGGEAEPELSVEVVGAPVADGARVSLAEVGGRWVAHELSAGGMHRAADGVARVSGAGTVVEPLRPAAELRGTLLVMGCAGALGLLADRLEGQGARTSWVSGSSTRAIEALAAGRVHVAGVHLVDPRTGEPNAADIQQRLGDRLDAVALVTLGRWEVGLGSRPAGRGRRAPLGLEALADPMTRLVTREAGSGVRRVLEQRLTAAGLPRSLARGHLVASGHEEVARAVALGAGDLGVASRDAAILFGLAFTSLAEERYDLAIPSAALGDARVARFLDVLTTGAARRELVALGYDMEPAGTRVGEVRAACAASSRSS